MPTFSVVLQRNVSPDAESRSARSTTFSNPDAVKVKAPSLPYAVLEVAMRFAHDPQPPRIVSAEELLVVDPASITDDRLVEALTRAADERIEFDEFGQEPLADRKDFAYLVRDVARALHHSGIIPGLDVTIEHNNWEDPEFVMVEVVDRATHTYRSVGRLPESLTKDAEAAGREGYLAIARALIETVVDEQLL